MNKNTPTLTHTETLAYAIQYVNEKYRETEDKALAAEQQQNFQFAAMIREAFPWKAKLAALCTLYEMETGSEHEFKPEGC
ncbi:MAG: hypothetical protein J6M06_04015 [Synergistaceae bacterium]|nr:hypothetical protein [Synergistaceae bacterium]